MQYVCMHLPTLKLRFGTQSHIYVLQLAIIDVIDTALLITHVS